MTNCIFCKISKNEIPSSKVIENDHYFVIKDIQPQAKKHFLVIPKLHIDSIHQATDYQGLHETIRSLVIQQNLAEVGYRLVINTGDHGGQSVQHLHAHVLSDANISPRFA